MPTTRTPTATPRPFDKGWEPPDYLDGKLGRMNRIACGSQGGSVNSSWLPPAALLDARPRPGRTSARPQLSDWPGADSAPILRAPAQRPHLPFYPGFTCLGLGEFECVNDEQGRLCHQVPVYRNNIFHRALQEAGVAMTNQMQDSHPACEFVLLGWFDAGEYLMGSLARPVRIVRPFLLARTQTVQAVWRFVAEQLRQVGRELNPDPSHFKSLLRPVETVSWNDCMEFCARTGLRLPSEAQWEYGCRAGSTTDFCFGDSPKRLPKFGWFADNANQQTHEVAALESNAFGLFDMHGNVWEWCYDEWHEEGTEVVENTSDEWHDERAWGQPAIDPTASIQVQLANDDGLIDYDASVPADPTTAPVRPTASSGAVAGTSTRPSAGPHTASGPRPATATSTSAAAPQEGENRADPTDPTAPARPTAPSGAAAGTQTRPTADPRTATGSNPVSPAGTSASVREGEQGADPTTQPSAPSAAQVSATGSTANRQTDSGVTPEETSGGTTGVSGPQEGEERADPHQQAHPLAPTGAVAGAAPMQESFVASGALAHSPSQPSAVVQPAAAGASETTASISASVPPEGEHGADPLLSGSSAAEAASTPEGLVALTSATPRSGPQPRSEVSAPQEDEQGADPTAGSTVTTTTASLGEVAGSAATTAGGPRVATGALPAAAASDSGQQGDEQSPDPTVRPTRGQPAGACAVAGAATQPTAGPRTTTTGGRGASAPTVLGSAPQEDEQSADPTAPCTPAAVMPEAAAGSSSGSTADPELEAWMPPADTAPGSGSVPVEGEQGADPTQSFGEAMLSRRISRASISLTENSAAISGASHSDTANSLVASAPAGSGSAPVEGDHPHSSDQAARGGSWVFNRRFCDYGRLWVLATDRLDDHGFRPAGG